MEHFDSVFIQPTTFDASVLSEIPQWPTNTNLALAIPPTLHEVHRAIKSLSNVDCLWLTDWATLHSHLAGRSGATGIQRCIRSAPLQKER